jgi:DivIVA domain-containing protein
MSASDEAESSSAMAVQRRFDVVLRGYDPAEVDAHLKRVSEWFSQSRAGRLAREQERRFTAREAEVSAREREAHELLEGARVEEQATLEGARLRAEAQLREADTERARILDEARLQAEASEVTVAARAEADRLLGEARAEAERIAAETATARSQQLEAARLATEQLMTAARAQVADEKAALQREAESSVREYVERRQREIDRLVHQARRGRGRRVGRVGRADQPRLDEGTGSDLFGLHDDDPDSFEPPDGR